MDPVADLSFSVPSVEVVKGPGSYLVSTSQQGGVIIYRIPDGVGCTTEQMVRASDADGTVSCCVNFCLFFVMVF